MVGKFRPLFLCLLFWFPIAADADDKPSQAVGQQDLTNLNIEDLMKVQVTSVSKHAESLTGAAAAVFVLTADDIRRSGATTIPDLLRIVPGVQVAQVSANAWAVSVRGMNGLYADKLLVLIDGRSVYSPLYAGVDWSHQNVMIEDIDRIEVVRGPGGTLWGANAVNGVINIVTKSAADTKGGLLVAGGGERLNGLGTFRYGESVASGGSYRLYGNYAAHGADLTSTGQQANDAWDMLQGGFRFDSSPSKPDKFTIDAGIYDFHNNISESMVTLNPPYSLPVSANDLSSGWHLLGKWERASADGKNTALQIYIDHNQNNDPTSSYKTTVFDLDFQHDLLMNSRQHIVWGLGARQTDISTNGTFTISYSPSQQSEMLYNTFLQDDITLNRTVKLTLGTKLEYNNDTGLEIEPNVRLAFTPNQRHTLWGSISRAAQTSSFVDYAVHATEVAFPGEGGANAVTILGNPNSKSEHVVAYELGYRAELNRKLSVDIAAYYNDYSDLRSSIQGAPIEVAGSTPYTLLPLIIANQQSGHTQGFELSSTWKPVDRWKLSLGYAFEESHLKFSGSLVDEVYAPRNQVSLRSNLNLTKNLDLDTTATWVDQINDLNVQGYWRLDARIGWRLAHGLELSLVGLNLFNRLHPEFGMYAAGAPELTQQSIFGKVTWHF